MTHCRCIYWGVSNAWSHHTQETSQNFSSWVRFFSPFLKWNLARVFADFKNWNSALEGPLQLLKCWWVSLSQVSAFLTWWPIDQFLFHWHQFYTCIIFDLQRYCSSLILGYFEWCLKHLSAILQLTAHHLILFDAISSCALCNGQHLQGRESLDQNK